jgi:hypothetical protein
MEPNAITPDYTLKAGELVYVRFAVRNEGNEKAPVGKYIVKVDGDAVVNGFAPVTLAPGDSLVIQHTFTYNSTGVHMVRCKVDSDDSLDELDEYNNGWSTSYLWMVEPEGEVDLYDEDGIVNICFPPYSFDDPPGDVDDPIGCVCIDNRFLARFSPEQIEEGLFSYIDNPEMNEYIKNILHDLGVCSLDVFVEGKLSGTRFSYSKAAKFNIYGDNYQRLGNARVWEELEDFAYERFTDLREAREIIEDNDWNFTADLTLPFMKDALVAGFLSDSRSVSVLQSSSYPGISEFDGEFSAASYSGTPLPRSFDWRNKDEENWMTPVRNQSYVFRNESAGRFEIRYCGSCYVMGVFGAVEAFYNIELKNNPDFNLDLSEQHADCKFGDKLNPLVGGDPIKVYEHLRDEGFVTEECLPYVADRVNACDLCQDAASMLRKVTDYEIIGKEVNAETLEEWKNIIKENLLETPLTFSVGYTDDDTYDLVGSAYAEGIFPLWHGGLKHCMVLAGWGDTVISEDTVEYWIVKNSAGPAQGYNGYFRMKMADEYDKSIDYFFKPVLARPEFGVVSVEQSSNSEWHSVELTHNFINPIVVMGPPSYNDFEATTIRVKDVTKDGFKFQLDPWDLEDENHGTETISYVVMEEDVQYIDDGIWEAGSVSGVDHRWKTVNLKSGDFDEPPVILTQTIKNYYAFPLVTRVKDVTTSSFKVMLQKQEYGQDFIAPPEEVHYVAIEPNSCEFRGGKIVVAKTGEEVTHEWYNEDWTNFIDSPKLIARIQSYNEVDPCALRHKELSNLRSKLKVEEEQSEDTEVEHSAEDVGYLVVSGHPEAPSNLSDHSLVPGEDNYCLYLTWENNSSIVDLFFIEKKEGTGPAIELPSISAEDFPENPYPVIVKPAETYTFRIRAFNQSTGLSSAYSDPFTVTIPEKEVKGPEYEFDKISVYQSSSSEWKTVSFSNTYNDPIVMIGPPSCNGNQPTTVRVKDVSSDEFKFQIDEWDYLDGRHNEETISYLVMEAGVYSIGGVTWEAGKVEEVNHNFTSSAFTNSFEAAPVLLTQIVTCNESSAVCTRVEDLTGSSFQVKVQEEEGNNGTHTGETIHYIAVSSGSGQIDGKDFIAGKTSNSVRHEWYTIDFGQSIDLSLMLASINTEEGRDPCVLRYDNLGNSSVEVKVEEEQSGDDEVRHNRAEALGYLILSLSETELATFTTTEDKVIFENYIKLVAPLITGNLILNISSNYDRKASVELIDVAGRVVKRKNLNLKRGREDLNFGQFKAGVYFLRIKSDEMDKHEVHKIMVLR